MQPGGAALASTVRAAAGDTLSVLAKSRIGLSGLALALAGFLGLFGVLNLQLQQGILSAYVLLAGGTLILFSLGAQSEALAKYFGFMYRPNGQLGALLLAGNLAWSSGWPGALAALFTNFVAISSWYAANVEGAGSSLAAWLPHGGANRPSTNSATGMVDVDRDELL